jgi:tetratricopeptide (TPR) repeat protein
MARYSLGMALLQLDQVERAIDELRHALATRAAAFPDGNTSVAESMKGLGDALAVHGDHAAAAAMLTDALAMFERHGAAESASAMSAHILLGMSLEELDRRDDAIAHYLRGADLADRVLQNNELQAVTGLELAAAATAAQGHPAAARAHLARALALLARAHAPAEKVARVQTELDATR